MDNNERYKRLLLREMREHNPDLRITNTEVPDEWRPPHLRAIIEEEDRFFGTLEGEVGADSSRSMEVG